MSARDDYPVLAGFDYCAAALDEIDRLRDIIVDRAIDDYIIESVRGLSPQHIVAIAGAVNDYRHWASPVDDDIRSFCRYLIEDYAGP